MASEARENLTLWGAVKELGWFSGLLALLVGGPSVVSIVQAVFLDFDLIPVFQAVIDAYNEGLAFLGRLVEPVVQPLIAWLNARFNWALELQPHWRPLFALAMVLVVALMRYEAREGRWRLAGIALIVWTPLVAAGAVAAGLAPLHGGWLVQGVAAAAVLGLMGLGIGVSGAVDSLADGDPAEALSDTPRSLVRAAGFAVMGFALGALLSLVPVLASGASVAAVGAFVIFMGVVVLLGGLSDNDASDARFGLTMLGGFLAAGLIVAADAVVKAFA